MSLATIAGHEVHLDEEGFMTEYDEWDEEVGTTLASNIGIEMTNRHWDVIRFLREDYKAEGEPRRWHMWPVSRSPRAAFDRRYEHDNDHGSRPGRDA